MASALPTLSKTLMLVLCTRINAKAGTILPEHQPSLSWLARAGSMCRTSVRVHLRLLETEGWVTSFPPPIDAQRREHARTRYELHVPGSEDHREARRQQPPSMRREARRARARELANGSAPSPRRPARPAPRGDFFDAAMNRAAAKERAAGGAQ